MPHVIVEYTDNLGDDARIPQLLQHLLLNFARRV